MGLIIVSCVWKVAELAIEYRPEHLISISAIPDTPPYMGPGHHHKLNFADIDDPTSRNLQYAAKQKDIEKIISIGRDWDGTHPLLINCTQGHRRSPAAAYILASARYPGRECSLFASMRRQAPYIDPNPWMVRLADELLERDGVMIKTILNSPSGSLPPKSSFFVLDTSKLDT